MTRLRGFGLAVIAVTVFSSALLLAALPASATGSDLPSYYQQLDFNLTSPTAWATATGGFANPAVYSMAPGMELEYFATVLEGEGFADPSKWGLFWGLENLGFGALHERVYGAEGYQSVTDYRLALSGGTRASTFGVALGWSRGDTDALSRHTVVQVGTVERPLPYLSFGIAGTFSTETADQSGLFDIGVRPLGDERFTLFGDLELRRGDSLENAPWSAGAMLEFPAGLKLIGRYFEDESFSFGVAYTMGGAREGMVRGAASPRFNKDGNHVSTNYGGRIGYAERSQIAEWFKRSDDYLELTLRGPIVHTRYKYFDNRLTLLGILNALEAARTDHTISGVAINLSGAQMSSGHAWEIRRKLMQLRAEGKRVVAYIDNAYTQVYHVASAADHLVMDPEGIVVIPGFALSRTYLKQLIDRLEIGVEEWRFKDYKSAMEPLVREDMSPQDREQRQALVDEYYRTFRSDVAEARGFDASAVDGWINEGTMFVPSLALEDGLVDQLGRWDDVKEAIEEMEDGSPRMVGARSLARYAHKPRHWGERPRIVVLYAIGVCALDSGIRARQLSRTIDSLAGNKRVKAVVLRVNSPGGSGMASDHVAEAIKRCREHKPVVVSQGDVAASGGYWLSMYADEIVVQPTTVTGSIGTIGGWVWDKGVFQEKMGLTHDFVKAGESADVFAALKLPFIPVWIPHRPLRDDERQRIFDGIQIHYDGFVEKVAEGREMSVDDVHQLAKGRVYSGTQGVSNGLADRVGGLDDAITVARELAGFEPDDDVRVVNMGLRGLFDAGALNPLPDIPFLFKSDSKDGGDEWDFLWNYELAYLQQLINSRGKALYLVPPELVPSNGSSGME